VYEKLARNVCDELAIPQDPQVLTILTNAFEGVAETRKEPTERTLESRVRFLENYRDGNYGR
jgi:hypothetical protein